MGFAELRKLKGIFVHPASLLSRYPFAVSLVVSLKRCGSYDSSTEDDFAFPILDVAAKKVGAYIRGQGHGAKVILADKRVGRDSPIYWRGEISHKAVAKTAGLGWIGRSTLLVTPDLGPRVCLATVLTDMPVPVGRPLRNRCGACEACVRACPEGALRCARFSEHPARIEDSIDVGTCDLRVEKTHAQGILCFKCMLACPKGVIARP